MRSILLAVIVLFTWVQVSAWADEPAVTATASPTPSPAVSSPSPMISRAGREHRRPDLSARRGLMVNQIAVMAHRMEGVPYVFGGTSSRGIDCSGFTMRIFRLVGIKLKRTADAQYRQGIPVASPSSGDLVFFSTYLPGPSHVGIYLGGRMFIHASCHQGVTVSSLDDPYYRLRYIGARRFF